MKNKLIYTLVFVSLILTSCNSTQYFTSGRYNENDGKGIFMIYPNKTFTYNSGEIPEKYSNGSWMQYENRIFINSTVQNKKVAANVEVVPENQKNIQSINGDRVNINLQVPDSLFTYRIFTNTSIKFKRRSIYFTDPEKGNSEIKYRLKDHKKSIIKSIKKKNLHRNIEEKAL